MRRWLNMWRNVVNRRRVDDDLDEELAATFDQLVSERIAAGECPDDARRAAQRQLWSAASIRDRIRDVRAGALVDAFFWDVRYGARLLCRNPAFALIAVLSLAIGIGAATSIFTVANGLLLRAAPGVADPDTLIDISRIEAGQPMANPLMAHGTYRDLAERMTTVVGLYVQQAQPEPVTFGSAANAERIFATIVSGNYFDLLGVVPAAGRLFNAADEAGRNVSRLVVLSHAFWVRQFQADKRIVGSTVLLDGDSFNVTGVAPAGFWGTSVVAADVWMLVGARPFDRRFFDTRVGEWGLVGGRLQPGVSREQAAGEVDAIALALGGEYPHYKGVGFLVARASPIPPGLRFVLAGFLALLLGLISLVLLIACANVAGVLIARAVARRREIAVRVAIGAGRSRLIRQLLTETLLLFAIGGVTGLGLAQLVTTLLLKLLPVFPVPIALSLPVDARVLAFTAAVSLAAAVLSGLAPALHVSKADVVTGLKDDSHGARDRLRLRSAFVVAQVAFSVLLVVAAGLLGRAMTRTVNVSQGVDMRNLAAAPIDLAALGYTETSGPEFARALVERLRTAPGVEAVTLADQIPLRTIKVAPMSVPGVAPPDGQEFFGASWSAVEAGYFETLGLPLLSGRDFETGDRFGSAPVAIIAAAGARQLWPGEEPIGRFIQLPGGQHGAATTFQIIGVAGNLPLAGVRLRERGADASAGPLPAAPIAIYVPIQQRYASKLMILMRSADARGAQTALDTAVRSLNAQAPIPVAEPLATASGPVQVQLRVAGSVAGVLGVIGMLLAAMGVYGVMAYGVVRRTREIGIRIAMGADRTAVAVMVLRQGMALVTGGAAIGIVLSIGGGRLLRGVLFGAPSVDPVIYAGAAALFLVIGLAACYLPTRRALAINAMEALRYE